MSQPRSWSWVIGVFAVLVLVTSPTASADKGDAVESLSTVTSPAKKLLSRHRRYLVFPEGSTFTAAFCATAKALMIKEKNMYTLGVAWGISYDLPNNSREIASIGAGIEPSDLRRLGRRDRRDLYRKLEIGINAYGLNGRACVLRAICEARDLPGEKGKTPTSLPLEILRTILNVPVDSFSSQEPYEHHEYALARRLGMEGGDCEKHYAKCPMSILSRLLNLVPTTIYERV